MFDTLSAQSVVNPGFTQSSRFKFLLISNNPACAQGLRSLFAKADSFPFDLRETDKISDGIRQLLTGQYTTAIVDLDFSNQQGLEVLHHLCQAASKIPIIILADDLTADMSLYAIMEGVQDILRKDELTTDQLTRSIRFANIRKQLALGILSEEHHYKSLMDNAPSGIVVVQNNLMNFANAKFANIIGTNSKATLLNKSFINYIHPSYLQYYLDWIKQDINNTKTLRNIELFLIKQDNTPTNVEMAGNYITLNGNSYFQMIINDIGERKKAETELQTMAQSDALSGIFNRNFLDECVKQAIQEATKKSSHVAILYLVLDHFNLITETHGFKTGELLSQAVMQRLKKYVRKTDSILALNQDKFVIVLHNVTHQEAISQILKKIIDIFTMTFHINNNELFTTASIGISLFPENGNDSQTLLKNADLALYHAKLQGKNNFQFFTESMTRHRKQKADLLNDLRQAIINNEFLLYYQPIVDARTNAITSLEALLRWNRANREIIMPSDFIGLAEESGLIIDIGEWVFNTVCQQNIAWQSAGIKPIPVAVNLSLPQFHKKYDLAAVIKKVLDATKLPPQYIQVELSENVTVLDVAADMLQNLKTMGIQLTIDDFGAGYFSFNDLKRYGINIIKIDLALVSQLPHNKDKCDIVAAIIAMTKQLRIDVIAEGVETQGQVDFLTKHGCYLMQGKHLHPVMTAEELINYLK